MGWLTDPQIWASLVTLTALEIVLGIDNLVFIAIVAGRLPSERQNRARRVGLALALITRLALLASIVWIIGLTRPVFELVGQPVSWRDMVLIAGGLFLLYKGTREIHQGLEGDRQTADAGSARTSFASVVAQIMLLDLVFSLDSVITAVGMANTLWVMAAAIVVAVAIMLAASKPLADFVGNPSGEGRLAPARLLRSDVAPVEALVLAPVQETSRWPACRSLPATNGDGRGVRGKSTPLWLRRLRLGRSSPMLPGGLIFAPDKSTGGAKRCVAPSALSRKW
jgi:predicted tellurium resistance membrane protein TerC